MSGITVGSGGPIEVDPVTLRAAAGELDAVQASVTTAQGRFLAADDILAGICMVVSTDSAATLLEHTRLLHSRIGSRAESLRAAADLYETSELLRAQQLGQLSPADRIRLSELGGQRPGVLADAARLTAAWRAGIHDDLLEQAAGQTGYSVVLGPYRRVFARLRELGLGSRMRGMPLRGPLPDVDVRRTKRQAVDPPAGFEDLMRRVPAGSAQVRVERYRMPDGERVFVVYVDGTRKPFTDTEAWNFDSNLDLYLRGAAAPSYAVTLEAMRQAGMRPGDRLISVGYSQGGMIGEVLAQDPRYAAPLTVSFGSPQEAEVGSETQHIAVRHSDDLVANLAGGGIGGRNGSPDSAVVERLYDPDVAFFGELGIAAHRREAYLDTARLMDGSEDDRLAAAREQLALLRDAEHVTVVEFTGSVPGRG